MTFRTALQDLNVRVDCAKDGFIRGVFIVRPDGKEETRNLVYILESADLKHIKDLEEEASQHLQEEVQDPPNSYDSRI